MDIKNIADAVTVLEFCYRRELLCDECGNLATVRNSFHQRCEAHKAHGARYDEVKVSALEKHIVSALVRWNAENRADDGQG